MWVYRPKELLEDEPSQDASPEMGEETSSEVKEEVTA